MLGIMHPNMRWECRTAFLRLELHQFGINVVVVEPVLIQTAFGSVFEGPMITFSGSTAYSRMAKNVSSDFGQLKGRRRLVAAGNRGRGFQGREGTSSQEPLRGWEVCQHDDQYPQMAWRSYVRPFGPLGRSLAGAMRTLRAPVASVRHPRRRPKISHDFS
ncbi:hypothetical protein A6U87_07640 [Rhizobium sp. AC44/96]|nr:hypothetical protein A6U87_07640 [Rhizobium sp. AC44/96]